MVEYFHLYVKVDCPFCKEAIDILEKEKREFVVTVLDHCKMFEDGIKSELKFKTVPIVLRCQPDGKVQMVGGCSELKVLMKNEKEEK